MICYKDMTFCPFVDCNKGEECPRVLTVEVVKQAGKMGLPISQFADRPECYEGECNGSRR